MLEILQALKTKAESLTTGLTGVYLRRAPAGQPWPFLVIQGTAGDPDYNTSKKYIIDVNIQLHFDGPTVESYAAPLAAWKSAFTWGSLSLLTGRIMGIPLVSEDLIDMPETEEQAASCRYVIEYRFMYLTQHS